MKKYSLILMSILFITVFFSCKKVSVQEENDEEVITTMILTFTPIGGGIPLTYSFDDPDGPGGNAPSKQTITLAPNKTYTATLILLNKTTNPATNITDEILNEAEAHRFYYTPTANANITINNLNVDANGIDLGTRSTWTTTSNAIGKVVVTLRHYPGIPPNKAASDLVTSSKSGTDIEVDFDTIIQ